MASYVNLDSIYRATAGSLVPHAWADQVNDNSAYFETNIVALLANVVHLQYLTQQSLVYRAASLNILTSADTLTTYDTAEWDPAGLYSFTTHLWTAPVTGTYQVNAQSIFNGSPSAQGFLGLYINASSGGPNYAAPRVPLAVAQGPVLIRKLHLTAGTTVGIDTWQDSGGTLTIGGSGNTFGQFALVAPDTI